MAKWKEIPGYPMYAVSDDGRVYSQWRGRVIKASGRGKIGLSKGHRQIRYFRVYALVAAAFIGPRRKGYQVHHINGDPTDHRLENLKYVKRGTHEQCHNAGYCWSRKLEPYQVIKMRKEYDRGGITCIQLSAKYGVSPAQAYRVIKRQTWKWL